MVESSARMERRARQFALAAAGVAGLVITIDLAGFSPVEPGSMATLASAALRAMTVAIALVSLRTLRDPRFLVIAALFTLMASRQTMSAAQSLGLDQFGHSLLLTEIPGHLVSVLGLFAVLYWIRVVREARERNEFQEQLHDEYERYRNMFEENTAVKMLIDPEGGSIVEANAAASEFYGWSRAELLSMNIEQINRMPRHEVQAEMARARDEGKRAFHFQHSLQNGEVRDVHVYSGPIKVSGRTLLFSIIFDVTERLRSEEHNRRMVAALDTQARALVEARQAAEVANRNKSAFLASMSHEIRTPMTAIIGFADMLRDPELEEEVRQDAIATIDESGRYLLRLINQILDLAKVEAGSMDLDVTVVSLPKLLSSVRQLLAQRAEVGELELRVEVEGRIPRDVRTDELKAQQVLVNLVGNAIKYTERGGVTLSAGYDAGSDQLVFDVEDTGPGLDSFALERIFEPFIQAEARHANKGTGLGLPIARQFAERLGGSLTAISRPGHGSVFTFRLPAATDDTTPWFDPATDALERREVTSAKKHEVPKLAGEVRVLVAEDVRANQILLHRILDRAGARTRIVVNGREAIDAVRGAHDEGDDFDVVLMDIQMPVMNGITAAHILRDEFPELPVLALTAGVTKEEQQAIEDASMRACLTKPVDPKALIEAVDRWTAVSSALH